MRVKLSNSAICWSTLQRTCVFAPDEHAAGDDDDEQAQWPETSS